MEFSSLIFIYLFLPIFLVLFFSLKKEAHNGFLVLVSLFFYAWGEGTFVLLLILSMAVNYVLALAMEKMSKEKPSRSLFWLGIGFNLALLVVFKYANFLAANLGIEISSPIHLPIGISFYTFLAISYLVDVYRETQRAERNFLTFALYISFFPKLVTGPITLYHDFSSQLAGKKREITLEQFSQGIHRFILGLGKKVLLADTLAKTANQVFAIEIQHQSAGLAWLGIVCYTLQIYFDFSGYSDMAIGLGRMLGFNIPENFNYPYISRSIKEFWTRWHITLANWLRDYLFLPIAFGMSRKIKRDRVLNVKAESWAYFIGTFVTFLLCGIWHGANWTFFFWGGYYGVLLIIEHMGFRKFLKKRTHPVFQVLLCQLLVMVGWVFFRSPNMAYAFSYLKAMFGFGTGANILFYPALYINREVLVVIFISVLGSFPLVPKLAARWRENASTAFGKYFRVFAANTYSIFLLLASTMTLAAGTHNPFIYFRF